VSRHKSEDVQADKFIVLSSKLLGFADRNQRDSTGGNYNRRIAIAVESQHCFAERDLVIYRNERSAEALGPEAIAAEPLDEIGGWIVR